MTQAVALSLPNTVDDDRSGRVSDETLARLAAGGDRAALDQLVRRWQVPLLRFLQRHTANRWDAEDVLQGVFLRVYQNLGRFDYRRSFRTWIFTIAYRAAVSHGRTQRLPNIDAQETPAVAPQGIDPSGAAEQRDQHRRLWDIAREHLTQMQYTALWLHYAEQMPAQDVAKVLGSSWISVKTMLHRARRRLMPHVKEMAQG